MALVLITHNMGVVAEMAQRVAVMYAGQVMEQRSAADAVRRAAASLHRGAAGRDARAQRRRRPPGHHPRRGAGRVRPARRLPVRAALRLRDPAFAQAERPALRAVAGRPGALPLSAGRSRSARRRSARDGRWRWRPREAALHDDRSSSRRKDLRRVYTIRRGMFREPAQLQAVGGVSFRHRRRPDAGGGRRIGLRQVDAGAHGRADREAHRPAR